MLTIYTEKFQEASANHNQIPRKTEILKTIMQAASADAEKVSSEVQVCYE